VVPLISLIVWKNPTINLAVIEKFNLPAHNFSELMTDTMVMNNENTLQLNIIWFIGFMAWLSYRLILWINFQQQLKQNSIVFNQANKHPSMRQFLKEKKITFYLTSISEAPFVTGLFSEKVYLPDDLFTKYSVIQQNCLIKHELTHLKKKDIWAQVLAEIVLTIFWFNPLMHYAIIAFKEDQEIACDYYVLAQCSKNERYEYGKVLLNSLQIKNYPAVLAFFNYHKKRFTMIEKHSHSNGKKILGLLLSTSFAFLTIAKAPVTHVRSPNFGIKEIRIIDPKTLSTTPKGLTIKNIEPDTNGFKIEGNAQNKSDVAKYMNMIKTLNSHIESNIVLKSLTKNSGIQHFVIIFETTN
jgi:beta-lactamase regulating signal transducer with metallopeptidase domain